MKGKSFWIVSFLFIVPLLFFAVCVCTVEIVVKKYRRTLPAWNVDSVEIA